MSGQFDPNVIVYSDEASMVNSSNGETTLPVVAPQVVEEPEMGLVPTLKLSRLWGFLVANKFW